MVLLVVFLTFIGWLDGLGWLAGLKTNITEEVLALYTPHALRSNGTKAQKSQKRSKGNGECYKFFAQDKTESWKDKKNEHIQYCIRLYHGYIMIYQKSHLNHLIMNVLMS